MGQYEVPQVVRATVEERGSMGVREAIVEAKAVATLGKGHTIYL